MRVVTPEQYKQGWLTWPTGSKPVQLIKKLPDGNYLVSDLATTDSEDTTDHAGSTDVSNPPNQSNGEKE